MAKDIARYIVRYMGENLYEDGDQSDIEYNAKVNSKTTSSTRPPRRSSSPSISSVRKLMGSFSLKQRINKVLQNLFKRLKSILNIVEESIVRDAEH